LLLENPPFLTWMVQLRNITVNSRKMAVVVVGEYIVLGCVLFRVLALRSHCEKSDALLSGVQWWMKKG